MTAHIVFAALDAEHPATLSEEVLEPLVRQEVGYRGVVVSDDLEMRAIADHYGIGDAAVRAVRAGCDQLLVCRHPALLAEAHEALVRAVEDGSLPRARLAEAAGRVRKLAQTYRRRDLGAPADLGRALADPDHAALLEDLEVDTLQAGADPTEPAIREIALEEGDPSERLELDT